MATSSISTSQRRSPDPIRVMVVEEHARVRQGLRMFLSTCSEIEVVAEAGDGAEALRYFTDTRPEVVVMHLGTRGMDSAIVTCRMKELRPDSQIIALTDEAEPDIESRALAAGAQCCVLKDSSAGALLAAIYEARAGRHGLGPRQHAGNAESALFLC